VPEPLPPPADEAAAGPPVNSTATTALILGIVSLFIFGIILGALAIYFGSKAEREIAASDGTLRGADRARWGRNLGIAGIVLWAILLLLSLAA
jgi:hypothetical protein